MRNGFIQENDKSSRGRKVKAATNNSNILLLVNPGPSLDKKFMMHEPINL